MHMHGVTLAHTRDKLHNNLGKIIACRTSDADVDEIVEIVANCVLDVVQMQSQISKADHSAVAHLLRVCMKLSYSSPHHNSECLVT